MKGSLDKGRAFKTEQAQNQIIDILTLEIANENAPNSFTREEIIRVLTNSGMVKNPENLIKDGWGEEMTITQNSETDIITVISRKLDEYKEKKNVPLQEK